MRLSFWQKQKWQKGQSFWDDGINGKYKMKATKFDILQIRDVNKPIQNIKAIRCEQK